MPNGYAFVIVLILIALVGGLVYCSFEINDLPSQLETAKRVNNTTIDQLTSCQQKEATCQADSAGYPAKAGRRQCRHQQLRNQTACGPVVPVTPTTSIGTTQTPRQQPQVTPEISAASSRSWSPAWELGAGPGLPARGRGLPLGRLV